MEMRADESANWQMGLKNLLADEAATNEKKRVLRICGDKLATITATLPPELSTLDLENAIKAHLRNEGLSSGYTNNLMSMFYKIVAASPKRTLDHVNATKWRALISQYNENSSVMRPVTVEYVATWVMQTGLEVGPLTHEQLMAFTGFLEQRGINPFESGTRYRRAFRKILIAAGLYDDKSIKHSYGILPEYEKLLKEMETSAMGLNRASATKVDLLAEDFGKAKEPIRAITWKKNKRIFIRYLNYQITRGFDGRDWTSIVHWKEIIEFVMSINGERPMAPATASGMVTALIACFHHLRSLGYLKMNDDDFKKNVTDELWLRLDRFEDYFEKAGKARVALPVYEKIYREFYENVLRDFKKNRNTTSARSLRKIVLAVFAVEFGWRPEDLKNTLRLEHIERRETLDGRKFYFVRYQPSKTNHGKSSMYASTALPPWFNEIFDLYFQYVRENSPNEPLFSIAKMSTQISQLSFRYLGSKYSANSYRKMLASFFSRHKIPGLYMISGRVADKHLELITEMEMKHYAEAATDEEALLEMRFGEKVRKILGIEDSVQSFAGFRKKPLSVSNG